MRKYIFIAFGGAVGAVLRFIIKSIQIYNYNENVPLNTLIINIAGSFLLSMILTIALEVWEFDIDLRLGIATGFLGAFTTFSTLCKESVILIQKGFYFSALSYVTVSVMLGLFFAYFGIILAREVISKIVKDESNKEYEGKIE
ncbi:camphor resistance protein CrcB [Caloramator quimbayensis]|uniref:Fluoride-specific ion channel FluC n=1 Tax=Caloramator quimbayensis TaxID=1147123 RepID=A0A1T4Y4Q6_9CLOT|nr:fluoride efflux transporter CrcB [Caloramator quimbayensis]SKA96794.1 camphor resistance protein CrcB [Caloramator quimbayensis]